MIKPIKFLFCSTSRKKELTFHPLLQHCQLIKYFSFQFINFKYPGDEITTVPNLSKKICMKNNIC